MLKTNQKAVTKKVDQYLIDSVLACSSDYGFKIKEVTPEAAATQLAFIFYDEKIKYHCYDSDFEYLRRCYKESLYEAFKDWCQGLPSSLNCDYYLNNSNFNAKIILTDWLQETEQEANKYSFEDSCELVTRILFNRINKLYSINNLLK